MNKNISPAPTLEEVFDIIRELRENETLHKQQLGKIAAFLQQQIDLQRQAEQLQVEASALLPAWMPSHRKDNLMKHIQSSSKIRSIVNTHPLPRDTLTKLRSTWLGQIYVNFLKQYALVRRLVLWIWRNGYPLYAIYLAPYFIEYEQKRWRQLTKLSTFAKKKGATTYKLADAVLVETTTPEVFPVGDQNYLVSPHDQYIFPEVFVAITKSAMIYGGTNLILTDDEVICHDLYDFERDYTSEELHGRTLIDPKSMCIQWMLHDKAPEPVPVAATFVDACAANYAHWMTEVMTRVALFCADKRFKGVPIVVNEGLHPNIMESLLLVAGADREIITLPTGRALIVGVLYLTSVAGYVPFERRTNKLTNHSQGTFSPQALYMLRNCFSELVGKDTESQAWPEKIFLRRNSGTRKVSNAAELEKLLFSRGYMIIDPEKLTFLEQTQLFKNANIIISSTGAALANAIGCKPGAQVAILMSKHENMIYRYWCNMLTPIQIKVSYVLGNIIDNHDLGIHGDFLVNTSDVIDLLDTLERK